MNTRDEFLDFLTRINTHIDDIVQHIKKDGKGGKENLLKFIDQKRKFLLELMAYIQNRDFNEDEFESIYRSCEAALLELIRQELFTFENENEKVSFFGKIASLKSAVIEGFAREKNSRIRDETPVRSIKPIEESRNLIVIERSELDRIVEKPLLKACQILYDKNIRTLSSSANEKDLMEGAYIIIDYDHLSDENKEIAKKYGKIISYDGMSAVKIFIHFDKKTLSGEIEEESLKVANSFEHQKMTWVPRYTFKELLAIYRCKEEDGYTPEDFSNDFYYDKAGGLFYYSKEHYLKSKDE